MIVMTFIGMGAAFLFGCWAGWRISREERKLENLPRRSEW